MSLDKIVHRTESYQAGFFHWQRLGSFVGGGGCRSERPHEIPHPVVSN